MDVKIVKEFKEFATKGNVVDLAVGVIIGGAFGKIVTSLVNDVIMPPVGLLLGNMDFKDLTIPLVDLDTWESPDGALPPAINYGQFISVVLDFLIVAASIFFMVKMLNNLRRKKPEAPKAPTEKDCPYCLSKIPIKATRCGHCTSQLTTADGAHG